MPILLTCACGRTLRAQDDMAGRKVKCPQCGSILPVPKPEADAADEVAEDARPDRGSRAGLKEDLQTAPRPMRVRADEGEDIDVVDDDDPEEERRRRLRRAADCREDAEEEEDEREERRRRRRRRERPYPQPLASSGGGGGGAIAAGVVMLVIGLGILVLSLAASAKRGGYFVAPIGLIVGGIAAIVRGANR
jgi:hypothetical protein